MVRARLRRAAAEGERACVAEADEIAAFIDTALTGMAARAGEGTDRDRTSDASASGNTTEALTPPPTPTAAPAPAG